MNAIDGSTLVTRRHAEWLEHQIRWRWLLDSYEGGDRYRNAVYGPDRKGLPCRNLFRHRREYPDPQEFPSLFQGYAGGAGAVDSAEAAAFGPYPGMLGSDPASTAQDDDYELRRSRTPVPEWVAEAVAAHMAKIYSQEVRRSGPADLELFWADVDGRGTSIADWMREEIAPLLGVLGALDLCFDHPPVPAGETVVTRADELRLGIDRCTVSYILPQNMLWWRLDAAGRYAECLVREYVDASDRVDHAAGSDQIMDVEGAPGEEWQRDYVRYRYWTATESRLYNYAGDKLLSVNPHPFGRVPIVRLLDQFKFRCPHVGKSRYEGVAELQREYYNRSSELILSDTLQAHPFLSGPEDFCKADNTLSVGPGYILPKKKIPEKGDYAGWEFVSPSKDPSESIRRNMKDLEDAKDRAACLVKPAGVHGAGAHVVSQSALSKRLDAHTGHMLLASLARTLARSELLIAEYALLVLRHRAPAAADRAAIQVVYPARFELESATEIVQVIRELEPVLELVGSLPTAEGELIESALTQALPGLSDGVYRAIRTEIERLVDRRAAERGFAEEAHVERGVSDASNAFAGQGAVMAGAEVDPLGESDATEVANWVPEVM